MNEVESGYSLAEVAGILRRRLLIVVGSALLGVLVAAGYIASSGATYEATARVVIRPITTDPFANTARPTDLVNAGSEAASVQSDEVVSAVKEELGLEPAVSDLRRRVTVVNPEDTVTLEITYAGTSPAKAQEGADAFAAAYLDARQQSALDSVERSAERLLDQITRLQDELEPAIAAQQAAPSGSVQRDQANATVESLRTRILALEEQRNQLISLDTTPGRIVQTASQPAAPSGVPNSVVAVGIVGLFTLLGLGLALLIDRRDPRTGGVREVERISPSSKVEVLPARGRRDAADGGSVREIALVRLAGRLGSGDGDELAHALVVGADERLPVPLVLELTEVLADRGRRTLVVCAGDVRPPAEATTRVGLQAVLDGVGGLDDITLDDEDPVLWLLPEEDEDAGSLLRRGGVKQVFKEAVPAFDTIVFLAPTPARFAISLEIARQVDSVIVVAGRSVSRRNVRDAVGALVEVDTPPREVLIT